MRYGSEAVQPRAKFWPIRPSSQMDRKYIAEALTRIEAANAARAEKAKAQPREDGGKFGTVGTSTEVRPAGGNLPVAARVLAEEANVSPATADGTPGRDLARARRRHQAAAGHRRLPRAPGRPGWAGRSADGSRGPGKIDGAGGLASATWKCTYLGTRTVTSSAVTRRADVGGRRGPPEGTPSGPAAAIRGGRAGGMKRKGPTVDAAGPTSRTERGREDCTSERLTCAMNRFTMP